MELLLSWGVLEVTRPKAKWLHSSQKRPWHISWNVALKLQKHLTWAEALCRHQWTFLTSNHWFNNPAHLSKLLEMSTQLTCRSRQYYRIGSCITTAFLGHQNRLFLSWSDNSECQTVSWYLDKHTHLFLPEGGSFLRTDVLRIKLQKNCCLYVLCKVTKAKKPKL